MESTPLFPIKITVLLICLFMKNNLHLLVVILLSQQLIQPHDIKLKNTMSLHEYYFNIC